MASGGTLAKGRQGPPAHFVSASSAEPGAALSPREVLQGEGVSLKGQHFVLVAVVCLPSLLHLPFPLSRVQPEEHP